MTMRLREALRDLRRQYRPRTVFSDAQLLMRFCATGEETAFHAIVERHGPAVRQLCRRLLIDHADAEDAFQGTFLILARKAHAIRKHESVGSWLYGVAYRLAS